MCHILGTNEPYSTSRTTNYELCIGTAVINTHEPCKCDTRTLRVLTPSDSDGLLNHHLFCLPRGSEGLDRSQLHLTNFIAPPCMHAKVLFRDIFLCSSNVNNNERLSMYTVRLADLEVERTNVGRHIEAVQGSTLPHKRGSTGENILRILLGRHSSR